MQAPLPPDGPEDDEPLIVPVDPVSVVDQVTVKIRRSIISGELPPGKGFSINKMAARLGVSHIPVREALQRLEVEGLLILRPGAQPEVRPMNRDDVVGIYRLRLLLEPELAAESALLLTKAGLTQLESILDGLRNAATVDKRMAMHRRFHLALLQNAMTDWELRVWDYLYTANERYARLLFTVDDDTKSDSNHFYLHMQLLVAAQSRSEEGIRLATTQHLARNQDAILSLLDEEAARPPAPVSQISAARRRRKPKV